MNCIICGDRNGKIAFYGSINNMKVTFCDKHINDCDNCDSYSCDLVLNKEKTGKFAAEIISRMI